MTIKLISTNDKEMANGMRDTSKTPLSQSSMLAHQARLEQLKNGYVTTICPKCHEHPEITMTSKGERTIIRCPCGYIKSGEINF